MTQPHQERLHGSVVAVDGKGVLILGKAGSGKSGLALGLISLGALLVADDQVEISRKDEWLWAQAPMRLFGLIEARGVGILELPALERVVLQLAVDLDQPALDRVPEPRFCELLGTQVPLIYAKGLPNINFAIYQRMKGSLALT